MFKAVISIFLLPLLFITFNGNSQEKHLPKKPKAINGILKSMQVIVPKAANRSISFTNKEAAYYYTQSHLNNHQEYAWFEGMNIAKNRVFGGYNLYVGNKRIDNQDAEVEVFPYQLLRRHGKYLTEELWMTDHENSIEIGISGTRQRIGISLKGKGVNYLGQENNIAYYSPMEGDFLIGVGSKKLQALHIEKQIIYTAASKNTSGAGAGFYIAAGNTRAEVNALIYHLQKNSVQLKNERKKRMEDFLLQNVYISSDNDSLNLALNWIETTMNQLVTRQQGDGIYAGLPWFNEYWGRDEFISLPGATLVSGQFATAKKILIAFAKYQQKDSLSKFFGRVPNIVNPSNIDYHTTDGTPRFIAQLQDYVKYSGDVSIIKQLYPNVKNSIEGALKYWVDDKGYLLHEDNETWMDARDTNLVSYSPRGSRANDIQALWYNQLSAGVYFAKYMNDTSSINRWECVAAQVKTNFKKDYSDAAHDYLADRMTKEGVADFSLRPNQLFALDMMDDSEFSAKVIRKVWRELVYPWGVATLDQHNPHFHPFHLTAEYPKDEAYHNGTIWPWLNGIAMQRMISAEQTETAYKLFKNMNREALTMGVVGGLSENADAYPHQGQTWPKLTGAYLQAWSNAEHLRIWYQYFLGIRPDMTNNVITIAPRIPEEIKTLDYTILVGDGTIKGSYVSSNAAKSTSQKNNQAGTYIYHFSNIKIKALINIFPFDIQQIDVEPSSTLKLTIAAEVLTIELLQQDGKSVKVIKASPSKERVSRQASINEVLNDIQFAKPGVLNIH